MAGWCRNNNVSEFQIWSVSDIETMLLQPKNDHLLFAFFGISLQIRKRSLATELRARIAMKRKIVRVLKNSLHAPFLLRDPEADNYPHAEEGKKLRWIIRKNRDFDFRGVGFQWKEYFAYVNDIGEWDMANKFNRAIPAHDNPWLEFEERYPFDDDRAELRKLFSEIEQPSQAMLSVTVFIPFEAIVAVDEIGDGMGFGGRSRPTLYVPVNDGKLPCHPAVDVVLSGDVEADPAKRVKFFPDKFRSDEFN